MDKKFLEISQIKLRGIKEVDGMKFHNIEGGFGKDKKSMLAKEISNIHRRELKDINRRINDNIKRFKIGIDIIDLKGTEFEVNLKHHEIYTQNSLNRSDNIYLLSERGYSKLLKILEDDVAWEQYEKLVDGYFNMREEIKEQKPTCIEDVLISSLKEMKAIRGEVQAVKVATQENQEALQGIRDVVAINSNDWRNDCKELITKMAYSLGGIYHINDIYKEIYLTMDKRLGTKLQVRLTNKRRRMADEGVCVSKRNKLNYIDVISDDKKLIEGYVAIVKELAIKYGADKKNVV